MFDKLRRLHYYYMAMRDWRNGQTRTFKGRVGDRVSSSLTSRTTNRPHGRFYICGFAPQQPGDMAQMVERCVRNA